MPQDEGELTEIDEEETPLASPDIAGNAKHCVTHLWGVLATAILSAGYVGSTKREKKKIESMKDELGRKDGKRG